MTVTMLSSWMDVLQLSSASGMDVSQLFSGMNVLQLSSGMDVSLAAALFAPADHASLQSLSQ